jgi:hypothetical protein
MKRGFVFLTLILVVVSTLSFGKKLATLPGLLRPYFIVMDDQQLYVCHGVEVRIYSRKDFSLKGAFGKPGGGPQEFMAVPTGIPALNISLEKDYLLISSVGKVTFYSKEGKYIKEMKIPAGGQMVGMYQAIGDKFLGIGMNIGDNSSMAFTLNLFDVEFKKIKEIHKQNFSKGGTFSFPAVTPIFYVNNDRVIVVGGEDFIINTLDVDGKIVTSIAQDYKRLKVHDRYKNGVHEHFKLIFGDRYEAIKSILTFTDTFPAIQNIFADNGKIYIQTYLEKDGKYEFFIYSLDGKLIKRTFIPVAYLNGLMPAPYTFNNNTFYQLVENEDEEEWELHAVEIK